MTNHKVEMTRRNVIPSVHTVIPSAHIVIPSNVELSLHALRLVEMTTDGGR